MEHFAVDTGIDVLSIHLVLDSRLVVPFDTAVFEHLDGNMEAVVVLGNVVVESVVAIGTDIAVACMATVLLEIGAPS